MRHAAERTIPSLPVGVMGVHSAFLSLATLTFDFDLGIEIFHTQI